MKVAVGISGGVDSAVTAIKLREVGHEVIGVTMTLGRADEAQSLEAARIAAKRLDIELFERDFSNEWQHEVVDYLRSTYLRGQTPNPCVRCNEFVKFGLLPRWALDELGCDRFATGHYARLASGVLRRGIDHAKDQSYFLYRVAPEILARTLLPLGGMSKIEVRECARRCGLEVAEKGDSQDFCGGEPRELVGAEPRIGNVVTLDGRVIGRHRGFWNYTVGMRKGLGIGGGTPYYVVRLDAEKNEVIVAFRADTVRHSLQLVDTVGRIDMSLPVKVRSGGEPHLLADGICGIAPGQSAVFYDGDTVVGGGIIVG